MSLTLLPQEIYPGDPSYCFDNNICCTRGFYETFAEKRYYLIISALKLIAEIKGPVDYLQVFMFDNIKFYVISTQQEGEEFDDNKHYVTFLLPEEN